MTRHLLQAKFDFAEMILILKNGKNYLPICRALTQHLMDILEVACLKLDLLIKTNKEIDNLIANGHLNEKLINLESLCARSCELFAEIAHLPLMNEELEVLSGLLPLSKVGSKYAELLNLLYTHAEFIGDRSNPFLDMKHLHAK